MLIYFFDNHLFAEVKKDNMKFLSSSMVSYCERGTDTVFSVLMKFEGLNMNT